MTIEIENVHKTYLLGVEGVPALRYVRKKDFFVVRKAEGLSPDLALERPERPSNIW